METLHLFNCTTQSLVEFVPFNPQDVKIYCCGPTVYDVPHLGHARTYVFLDTLRRILRYHLGYGVRAVMNVTDLDDKIIKNGDGPRYARKYERQFFETMGLLNVERPDFAPRVTDFLYLADNLSKRCIIEKFAYYTSDFQTTYFSTKAYLARYDRVFPYTEKRDQRFQPRGEEEVSNERKWDPRDFAIWKPKGWVDVKGEKQDKMPGWHTGCATIASFYFPDCVDIHLGGIDLQFPHHENEIALARVYLEKKDWVRYCLYTGHLEIEGEKMSKSLKNFTRVDELLAEGFSPLAIRYMFMKFPYNKPMRFHKDEMQKAQKSYDNFIYHINRMKLHLLELKPKEIDQDFYLKWYDTYSSKTESDELNLVKKQIDVFLKDNLNVPKALEALENYVRSFFQPVKQYISYEWLQYCLNYVLWMTDTCFGLIDNTPYTEKDKPSDTLFFILKQFRIKVRDAALVKDCNETQRESLLKMCDSVREEMNQRGYNVED